MCNARFWDTINGSAVKFTLKPGESITHSEFHYTEEGYFSQDETWTWTGEELECVTDSTSRDCDGPLNRHSEKSCSLANLRAGWYDKDENVYFPAWEEGIASQQDVFAEAMGY